MIVRVKPLHESLTIVEVLGVHERRALHTSTRASLALTGGESSVFCAQRRRRHVQDWGDPANQFEQTKRHPHRNVTPNVELRFVRGELFARRVRAHWAAGQLKQAVTAPMCCWRRLVWMSASLSSRREKRYRRAVPVMLAAVTSVPAP